MKTPRLHPACFVQGIRRGVDLIKGACVIKAQPLKGTRIDISVPVPPERQR